MKECHCITTFRPILIVIIFSLSSIRQMNLTEYSKLIIATIKEVVRKNDEFPRKLFVKKKNMTIYLCVKTVKKVLK